MAFQVWKGAAYGVFILSNTQRGNTGKSGLS